MMALLAGASALIAFFGAGLVSLSWFVADRVVRPRRLPPTPILRSDQRTIDLRANPLSRFPGPMGLLYNDESRHARLGPVIREDANAITREIASTDPSLSTVSAGRVIGDPFGTPAEADLTADEILLESAGLQLPAWVLRGPSADEGSWAIHIHGAMAGRESMLRTASSFAGRGFISLVVTYRGDPVAAPVREGSTLGQAEWKDIEPAVAYALAKGADRIILVGMSLGATIAMSLLAHSLFREYVDGVVLVAPILNWRSSIAHNVRAARLPHLIGVGATRLLSGRVSSHALRVPEPLRFDSLDFVNNLVELQVPGLILHNAGDRVAPHEDSQRLAERFPNLVTLITFDGAEHALEWNHDTARFNRELATWLNRTS